MKVAERRVRGLTLVETLVAASLFTVLFGTAWLLFGTGLRGFQRGNDATSSMQDGLLFLERLEHDLDRMLVPLQLASEPVRILAEGRELVFLVPAPGSRELPLDAAIPAWPVRYTLVPIPGEDSSWPARNGVPFRRLRIRDWCFEHTRGEFPERGMQYLRMDLDAAGTSRDRSFPFTWEKALVTATMFERYGVEDPFLQRFLKLDPEARWAMAAPEGEPAPVDRDGDGEPDLPPAPTAPGYAVRPERVRAEVQVGEGLDRTDYVLQAVGGPGFDVEGTVREALDAIEDEAGEADATP